MSGHLKNKQGVCGESCVLATLCVMINKLDVTKQVKESSIT